MPVLKSYNAESVAVAWLRTLSLPMLSDASTTLPGRDRWSKETYCLVSAIAARRPDLYDVSRVPSVSADVFAAPGAWGPAFGVGDAIVDATRKFASLYLPDRVGFPMCRIVDVSPLSAPIPVRFNEADMARVSLSLEITYYVEEM